MVAFTSWEMVLFWQPRISNPFRLYCLKKTNDTLEEDASKSKKKPAHLSFDDSTYTTTTQNEISFDSKHGPFFICPILSNGGCGLAAIFFDKLSSTATRMRINLQALWNFCKKGLLEKVGRKINRHLIKRWWENEIGCFRLFCEFSCKEPANHEHLINK